MSGQILLGRGLKPPTPARNAHRMGALSHEGIALAKKVGIRGSADLTGLCPPRMNQQATSTCFAHSFSAALFCAKGAAGKPMPFVPSVRLLASMVYAKEQRSKPTMGAPLADLQDLGAELADVADVGSGWGVAPMGPTIDGLNSDVPDGPFQPQSLVPFPEADVLDLVVAGSELIAGEYSIPMDANAPETIAASLDAGIPVWIGGLVGSAYEALGPSDVAEPTPSSDTSAGGHAQVIASYRTAPGGALQFRVVGSWGTGWAFNGTVWASSDWVKALWQAYPMAVL